MQCYLEPLGQHYIEFSPVHCYPEIFKTTLNRTFSCTLLSGASRIMLHFLPVQYCLEPLGQHYTGFSSVQYCPKSISFTGKTLHWKTLI